MALILTFRWTGVTRYAAIGSPDFPLPVNDKQRPPDLLRYIKDRSTKRSEINSPVNKIIRRFVLLTRHFTYFHFIKTPKKVQDNITEFF